MRVFRQNELLTRQLGQVHEEAETVIRLRSELAKAEERIQVLSNASEFNGEAASLVEAMQGHSFGSFRRSTSYCPYRRAWSHGRG